MIDRLLTRLSGIPGFRSLWNTFPIGSLEAKVRYGVLERPHYAYGVYSAADLARRLGVGAITVIEFGVAGGRGLLALERIAGTVGQHFGIRIHVAGFDAGQGMPPPVDYRDLPHVWDQGFYVMDLPKLKNLLAPETELVIGEVRDSVVSWRPKATIGFIAFDLDYYSSTKDAFHLLERPSDMFLPRVYCYFDDMMWPEHALHNEYVGELCAIREFNGEHPHRKLCPIHMLRHTRPHQAPWNEQIYVFHDFLHPRYCQNITPAGDAHRQMPL
jgi:hypothetical protein